MKAAILCFGVVLLSYVVFAEDVDSLPDAELLPEVTKMGRPIRKCNLNLCFAIDGSDNLLPRQFRLQKRFVRRVVRRISRDNRIKVAATQYGLLNSVISPLTNDLKTFFKVLRESTFLDSRFSSMSAGVVYCQAQLRKTPARRAKIVILGSGESNFGGSPASRSRIFRNDGGEVFGVRVGDAKLRTLISTAGNRNNVYSLRGGGKELRELVQTFLSNLCG